MARIRRGRSSASTTGLLQAPLLRGGKPVAELPDLAASREHLRAAMVTLPWDGLKLSRGEPAIPTRIV